MQYDFNYLTNRLYKLNFTSTEDLDKKALKKVKNKKLLEKIKNIGMPIGAALATIGGFYAIGKFGNKNKVDQNIANFADTISNLGCSCVAVYAEQDKETKNWLIKLNINEKIIAEILSFYIEDKMGTSCNYTTNIANYQYIISNDFYENYLKNNQASATDIQTFITTTGKNYFKITEENNHKILTITNAGLSSHLVNIPIKSNNELPNLPNN